MPISLTELQIRLSGGASNADEHLSFGGAMSSVQAATGTIDTLFDDITSAEAVAGQTDYRCFYAYNANATIDFTSAIIYMNTLPGGDGVMSIGLDPGGVNTTPTAPADRYTAPSGVTFSSTVTSSGAALSMGTLPALGRYAFWLRRVQAANASPPGSVANFSLVIKGA